MRAVTRGVAIAAIASSALVLASCGPSKSDRAAAFRTLAEQRGVLPSQPATDEALHTLAIAACSDGLTADELYLQATTDDPVLRNQPTAEKQLVYEATIIDAYCKGERAKVEQAADRAGVALPPQVDPRPQDGSFDLATFAVVLAFSVAVVIPLSIMIYRDVEKRNGEGAKVAVAVVLFWPLGFYWWYQARKTDRDVAGCT